MGDAVLKPDPIVKSLHGAFCRSASRQDLLQLAASKILGTGAPYAGVGMYLVDDDTLRLQVCAGSSAAGSSIPLEQAFISEAIVPIHLHEQTLGGIAIETRAPSKLSETERTAVKQVADALAVLL